jgi:hypothetical protein
VGASPDHPARSGRGDRRYSPRHNCTPRGQCAVHQQGGTGDEACRRAGQEHFRPSDLLGFRHPPVGFSAMAWANSPKLRAQCSAGVGWCLPVRHSTPIRQPVVSAHCRKLLLRAPTSGDRPVALSVSIFARHTGEASAMRFVRYGPSWPVPVPAQPVRRRWPVRHGLRCGRLSRSDGANGPPALTRARDVGRRVMLRPSALTNGHPGRRCSCPHAGTPARDQQASGLPGNPYLHQTSGPIIIGAGRENNVGSVTADRHKITHVLLSRGQVPSRARPVSRPRWPEGPSSAGTRSTRPANESGP